MSLIDQVKKPPYFWPSAIGIGLVAIGLAFSLNKKGSVQKVHSASKQSFGKLKAVGVSSDKKILHHYQFYVLKSDKNFESHITKLKGIQAIFQSYVNESEYGSLVESYFERKGVYEGFSYVVDSKEAVYPLRSTSTAPYMKPREQAKEKPYNFDGVLFSFVEVEANH